LAVSGGGAAVASAATFALPPATPDQAFGLGLPRHKGCSGKRGAQQQVIAKLGALAVCWVGKRGVWQKVDHLTGVGGTDTLPLPTAVRPANLGYSNPLARGLVGLLGFLEGTRR
jgi:hypothetical protein